MKNKLIVIGYIGSYECYLNISEHEAILRYMSEYDYNSYEDVKSMMKTIEFDDHFCAYQVWT